MAAFRGYLLKTTETVNNQVVDVIFPHQYIQIGTWSTVPNQREEIKAYRDDNTRDLTRVTAAGRKTTISFKTRSALNKSQKEAIQTFFTSHESNAAERKITVTYWNDEENTYKSGTFYRPNMTFPILSLRTILSEDRTSYDIIYDELQIDLVEY